MPLSIPNLDDRRYQQLVDETLARIPVHTPEWTNFNQSDPGVTLIQLFAFLTESLLYRANQIPERNHKKFLDLLGVPLQPASSARGIVTFSNERGPRETVTLNGGLEVRAGQVPFRTDRGLDVLPVEGRVYFKRMRRRPPAEQREAVEEYERELAHYSELYASLFPEGTVPEPQLYEPVPLASRGSAGVDLGSESVDQTLWVALLLRSADKPVSPELKNEVRDRLAGKILSIGIVPQLDSEAARRHLLPGGDTGRGVATLRLESPIIPPSGGLPPNRRAGYRTLASETVQGEPFVFEVPLPSDRAQLGFWDNLDPLEAGSNDLPPALDDTALNDRLITWLALRWPAGANSRVQWAGLNAVLVQQRMRITNELVATASGEPDQRYTLTNSPVLPDSISVRVSTTSATETWDPIDDLTAAGPEVVTPDVSEHPGILPAPPRPSKVFALDPASGQIRFGDGFRGARPPGGAIIRVDYDSARGAEGNVGENAISAGPALPAGFKVTNPVRTWGGAPAETITEAEKQITRFLQHRDRLVTADDFETITLRTPGVEMGRVDVLPAYNPILARHEPGNAPGAVTLMVIPRYSTKRPDAPEPDGLFVNAVCDYLEPRRLVTTELFVRGPEYKPIFISVGIAISSGRNISAAVVRNHVTERLREFLAPVNADTAGQVAEIDEEISAERKGWPLRRPVIARELEAEVARVPGVAMVNRLILADAQSDDLPQVDLRGLQLPRIDGIHVEPGDALPIDSIRGDLEQGPQQPPTLVSVPAIPKEC